MKRICILVTNIFSIGGCERVAQNLANSFCEKYEVCLISIFNRGEEQIEKIDKRIKIYSVINGEKKLRYCFFDTCRKLNQLLSEIQPDITLLINASTYIFLLAFIGIKSKKVACEHTNLKNKFHTSTLLKKVSRLCAVLSCDKIVTLTREDMINYRKKYHLPEDKVIYIYNWIEKENLKYFKVQDGSRKKIISVGRFDKVKGYELLVDIAEKILNNHKDWQWHIYGAGDLKYKKLIQYKICEKNLTEQLIIMEPTNSIYQMYSEYSFLVLTSYYEGLPMVLLESKACGLPAVAFDCPTGPNEIIVNNENGYLVSCYDAKEMVEKIEKLINNKNILHEFSVASNKNLDKFDKDNILDKWDGLFDKLVKE